MNLKQVLKITLLIVILVEEIKSANEIKNRLNYFDSEISKLKVIRK